MTDITLTEEEYNICAMAVIKCNLLWEWVKISKKAKVPLMPLATKNFGFPDMTDEELNTLVEKLHSNGELALLKEQRKKEVK